MENRDNQLSQSLVPVKDTVAAMQETYVIYSQQLQRYYAFALTKAEIVFLSILVLALTHSMHIHYSNFFLVSEMLWIFIALYIRCFWVPYPSEIITYIVLSLLVAFLLFAFFTWFFLNQSVQQQAKIIFILWVISLAMYLPLIIYAICLVKNSLRVKKLTKQMRSCLQGKLKPIKVGRIKNEDKKSKKQIKFGSTKQMAQTEGKIEAKPGVSSSI